MPLKGKKPEASKRRLKMFVYGPAGVGKTMTSIQFPIPYVIDTEKGCINEQYIDIINEKGGSIFYSSDFDDILTEIRSLLTESHPYKTLVIDPLTTIYDNLLIESSNFLKRISKDKDATGTEMGRHYNGANVKMKQFISILLRLDMNVIITSHAKSIVDEKLRVIGNTFDCYKKMDYIFDLVLEIQPRGKDVVAVVRKTRIKSFPLNESFPFLYESIANNYGIEILEKKSNPENIATQAEIEKLLNLINIFKIPEETTEKWITKSNSTSFNDMPRDILMKCLEGLQSRIKSTANKGDIENAI